MTIEKLNEHKGYLEYEREDEESTLPFEFIDAMLELIASEIARQSVTNEDVRKILGLPQKNRRSKIRAMEFWELCDKGCSDAEIARYFGVTKQAANNYRNRNNAKRIAVC